MKKLNTAIASCFFLCGAAFFPTIAQAYERDLTYGSKGDDVKSLQEFLKREGLFDGEATGGFYAKTKAAMIAFQKREHISPSAGYCGKLTQARINEIETKRPSSTANTRSDNGKTAASSDIASLEAKLELLKKQLAELKNTSSSSSESATNTEVQLEIPKGTRLFGGDDFEVVPRVSGANVIFRKHGASWGLGIWSTTTRVTRDISSPTTDDDAVRGYEIDGNYVTYRMGGAIYLYNIALATSTRIWTLARSDVACEPFIRGNFVVWNDARNGNTTSADSNIFIYDIAQAKASQLTTDPRDETLPSIYGDQIVWGAHQFSGSLIADIELYDRTTGTLEKIGTGRRPRIYEDHVVWAGNYYWDPVILYDVATKTAREIGKGMEPQIDGDRITYFDGTKISVYDIGTKNTLSGFGNAGGYTGPDVYRNTLVWADLRDGKIIPEIYNAELPDTLF